MNFLKKGIKQSSGFLPLGGWLPNLTYFKGEERGWASTRLAGFSFLLRFKGHASNERGFFPTAKRTKPLFHFSQKKKPKNFKKGEKIDNEKNFSSRNALWQETD